MAGEKETHYVVRSTKNPDFFMGAFCFRSGGLLSAELFSLEEALEIAESEKDAVACEVEVEWDRLEITLTLNRNISLKEN